MKLNELSHKNAPVIKISPPGPKSKEYIDYQIAKEGASVSYPKGLPMAIQSGKGATIEDVDGNVYIDFFAGAGVMAVGHSNPIVIESVLQQLKDFTHALDFPNPAKRSLVETLFTILPSPIEKVFFGGPTGSDAVETAIKLAKFNTGRFPILAFEGGYHGMTAGALSVTSDCGHKNNLMPMLPEVHFVPFPYCYRCAFGKEVKTCELQCAKYFEHVLEDPHSGVTKPSCVIIEAIQGEGGTIVPPDGFLQKIREVCDRYGIIMIVDEIQSGFCRTGKMFSFEHYEIVPDIIVLSKALGGIGLPISGIAYKANLDNWQPGTHIGTYRGNTVAYAAGSAAIRFMVENKLARHSEQMGNIMLSMFKDLESNSEIIGEVRGKGLMIGIEIVSDKAQKTPSAALAKQIRTVCHQNGLLVEIGGHYGNVVRFLPPLVITENLLKKGAQIFLDAVRKIEINR